jgi:hypothetical protein
MNTLSDGDYSAGNPRFARRTGSLKAEPVTRLEERMKKRTKAELLAWIEQHQPVTREKLLRAFEGMDYEQLQGLA